MNSLKLKSWKFWLLVLASAFLFLQFVPVEMSNPPVEGDLGAPLEIRAILKRSCYDCHSHETVWPWYARIAPVSWLVIDDVKEGRKELNFSLWNQLTAEKRTHKLEECMEQIAKGEMPLESYLWTHPEAALSDSDRKMLDLWFSQGGR